MHNSHLNFKTKLFIYLSITWFQTYPPVGALRKLPKRPNGDWTV